MNKTKQMQLRRSNTTEVVREATIAEWRESSLAGLGGHILVDGVICYVEGDLVGPESSIDTEVDGAVNLVTRFGPVAMASDTFDVVMAVYSMARKNLVAAAFERDVELLRGGWATEELREARCAGTDPGSADEASWNGWVDAVAGVASPSK